MDFDIKDKEQWKLNGVQTTKSVVKEKVRSLNIQVDNPLQFLPQDKVGQFSNLSPTELLKHTEMAIGPKTYAIHQELIAADKAVGQVQQKLSSEKKTLDDEKEKLTKLQKDVDRWNHYQENMTKLKQMQGKMLWLRYLSQEQASREMNDKLSNQKTLCKDLKTRLKEAQKKERPLEEAKEKMYKEAKMAGDANKKMEETRTKLTNEIMAMEEDMTAASDCLRKVDRRLVQLTTERDKIEAERRTLVAEMDHSKQEAVKTMGNVDFEQVGKDIHDAMAEATKELDQTFALQAEDAISDHTSTQQGLERELKGIQDQLNDLSNKEKAKLTMLNKIHQGAYLCKKWLTTGEGQKIASEVIGPMMMDIEVHQPSNRKLVENGLAQKCAHQWGVVSWLDEALTLSPEDALKDHGIADFRMLTPSRNIMSAVSANGQKNAYQVMAFRVPSQNRFKCCLVPRSNESNSLQYQESSIPNADRGCFNAGADPARKEALEELHSKTALAIKSHETKTQSLNAAKQNALNEQQAIKKRKDQLTFATNRIHTFESKIKHKSNVLANAEKEIVNFDAEAQKSEYKAQVFNSMEKQIAKACHAFSILAQQSEKRIGETAALLSAKVAAEKLEQAREQNADLQRQVSQAEAQKKELEIAVDAANTQIKSRQKEARGKAPDLEPGSRDEASEKIWRTFSDDVEVLE
ncbi:MAG: hypothetical protein SGPRY_004928, partial [Prymnesium sp.]